MDYFNLWKKEGKKIMYFLRKSENGDMQEYNKLIYARNLLCVMT